MPRLQSGDVIACWGSDGVSRAISLLTSSLLPPWQLCFAPSHVAIVHQEHGEEPLWYESTTMAAGHAGFGERVVYGAQLHAPGDRWEAYRGNCLVFRPRWALSAEQNEEMGQELRRLISGHVPYDLTGAVLSGTWLLRHLIPASRRRMFCSEMVATVLQRVDLMNWSSPSGYSPGRLVRELVKTGAFEWCSGDFDALRDPLGGDVGNL